MTGGVLKFVELPLGYMSLLPGGAERPNTRSCEPYAFPAFTLPQGGELLGRV
jgi:hypothetical protein